MYYDENTVSIITPCFNGGGYIDSCFNSVINQTYRKIQFIFVDDGSTDGSYEKAISWKARFEDSGMQFVCLSKKNGGAASAVNLALKYVTGAYFEVLDVDDYIYPENIELKLSYLKRNPDVDFVRNQGEIFNVELNKVVSGFTNTIDEEKDKNIFLDLIFGRTYNWAGAFLIRTQSFIKYNGGNSDIFISQYGQNMQLLLPVAEKSKCGFVPDILTRYNEYPKSISHDTDYSRNVALLDGYKTIRLEVLKSIGALSDELNCQIEEFYNRKKMELAFRYCKKNDVANFYQRLKRTNKKDTLLYLRSKYKIVDVLFRFAIKILVVQKV